MNRTKTHHQALCVKDGMRPRGIRVPILSAHPHGRERQGFVKIWALTALEITIP
jgi:hypothetical protein